MVASIQKKIKPAWVVNCWSWHCGHLGMALVLVRGLERAKSSTGHCRYVDEYDAITAFLGMQQELWVPTQRYPVQRE